MEIISNGSKWAGEAPDDLGRLLELLEVETLDPRFEEYGRFFSYQGAGRFHAHGNFLTRSHVFSIWGTLDELLPLARALKAARRRPEYLRALHGPRRLTYRERRLRKAKRLRGWAESRDAKSAAGFARADSIAGMIPMGQPILVGHHSESRHRRDLERIDSGMRAGVESARVAERHRERADNIERAADRAIYSDDPDALGRLRDRIAELEAERDRIKAYNAACRKAGGEAVPLNGDRLRLLDDKQRENIIGTARACPYQIGKGGAAPTYWSANLSGNIGRQRKRLAMLERRAGASPGV